MNVANNTSYEWLIEKYTMDTPNYNGNIFYYYKWHLWSYVSNDGGGATWNSYSMNNFTENRLYDEKSCSTIEVYDYTNI